MDWGGCESSSSCACQELLDVKCTCAPSEMCRNFLCSKRPARGETMNWSIKPEGVVLFAAVSRFRRRIFRKNEVISDIRRKPYNIHIFKHQTSISNEQYKAFYHKGVVHRKSWKQNEKKMVMGESSFVVSCIFTLVGQKQQLKAFLVYHLEGVNIPYWMGWLISYCLASVAVRLD